MATELRLRGGTTAQHASFTGATKEITVDTTKNTVVVHDGSTAGGTPLATENQLTSEINNSVHAPGTGLPNELDDLAAVKGGNTGALTIGTNDATSLTLRTNNASRVAVNSDGNVGIGTSSPLAKLDVFFDSSTAYSTSKDLTPRNQLIVRNPNNTAGTFSGIDIQAGSSFAAAASISVINNDGTANTDSTLTFALRDNTTSIIERMRIASNGQQSSVIPGGTVLYPEYKCRAWVNFDGTTAPGTIRASGNVSSVIRNETGDYTVNFTSAMPDANYSANAMGTIGSQTQSACLPNEFTGSASQLNSPTARSVSSFRFFLTTSGGSKVNSSSLSLQFFR